MENIKKFLKSSGIFFIGNLLSRAISFLLLPVYTRYIITEDYGYYDLSITYLTIITSVLFFDIWSSIMRFMYDKKDDNYRNKSIFNGFLIFVFSIIIYIMIGIILYFITEIHYLWLIMIYGIILNIQNMYSFITRGYEKNIDFAISGIINTIFTSVSSIILIIGFKCDFSALYISGIIGNLIQIIYLESKIKVLRKIKTRYFDRKILKSMFKYTLPLCINSVSFWILTSYNRVVILDKLGIAKNGIYAIGNKFGVIITLVTTCFTLAWQEISFARKIDDENNSVFYSKACNMYIKFLGLGAAILIPITYIISPLLIDASYYEAINIIPLFLIATIINAFSNFIGNIFYALKQTKYIFISALISAIINIILVYPLIELWRLNGATFSMAISFILNIIIRYIILNKSIKLKFDFKQLVLISILIIISIVVFFETTLIVNCIWICLICILTIYLFKDLIKQLYIGLKKGR